MMGLASMAIEYHERIVAPKECILNVDSIYKTIIYDDETLHLEPCI